jgi:hypothetical protein
MSLTAARSRIEVSEPRVERGTRLLAAGCALVAGVTHAWVVPEHLEEWLPAGVFFVLVALAQLALVWSLRRTPDSRVVALALAGTVGLVLLYVASRTVDLPFLPSAHEITHLPVAWGIGNGIPVFPGEGLEEVGTPDLVCLGAELVLVGALCSLAPPAVRGRVASGLLGLGLGLLVLRLLGVLG